MRLRRSLAVLLAAGLCLSLAWPVSAAPAKKGEHPFEYGPDISSWYWNQQIDQEVTNPLPLPPPVPPASQRVRLPSPQRRDTLPVAVFEAQHERMSAIKFDLFDRGVTADSEIKKLVLRIEESIDKNEQPSYKPETAKIQACPVTELLAAGENEEFEDRPQFQETDCVEGTRSAPAPPAAPFWEFDLSTMAEPWGKDPFANNGVMLLGILQGGGLTETWQVNLKIPSRDDPLTKDVNEYDQTKNRAVMTLEYIPGELVGATKKAKATTTGAATGGTTPSVGGGFTGGGIAPSTDLTGATSPPPSTPAAEPAAPAAAPVASVGPPEPRIPSYVWLLIPLGLLGLSAVRSVVLEPVGGPRADGVIEAIRRRNAQRRGGPLGIPSDPLARAAGAVAGVGRAVRRGALASGRSVARVVGAVRRRG